MVDSYLGVFARMTDLKYQPGGDEAREFMTAMRLGNIAESMPLASM